MGGGHVGPPGSPLPTGDRGPGGEGLWALPLIWYDLLAMGNLAKPTEVEERKNAEESEYEAKTELGRKLVRLRKEIERSGVPLLDWDDLEREITERRGERNS